MSYEIEIVGSFRIEPSLSPSGCEEILHTKLGWRSAPNGAILYFPSDALVSDPILTLREVVLLVSRLGSRVAGEARWVGEDEESGSLIVRDGIVEVTGLDDEPLAESEIESLIEALRHGSETDRIAAINILAYMSVPFPQFAEPLASCLQHEALSVRLAAANALGGFGEEAALALGPLIAALDDAEAWVQAAAAEALGLIGHGAMAAVPALQRLEKHPNYGPSGRAREALARILK